MKTLTPSASTAIKAAASQTVDNTPAVIVSISQAALEATGRVEADATSITKLTPYSSKDITPEMLASVQKMLLDTYTRQTALAGYGSSTMDYSTRMSLYSVSKSVDAIKKYLVSPPSFLNTVDGRVASTIHSAASSYLSLKETSANYVNTKNYTHIDIGTSNTGNEELLKAVIEKSNVILKQELNLSAKGISIYDSKTLNYFLKSVSSVEAVRQALDKPSNEVGSLDFQFAVFTRQVTKGIVSDIVARRGGKQISIDKNVFDSIDKDSFIDALKSALTNDIDAFKKSVEKSSPPKEALKDAELSYEFVKKMIDCGFECIVETSQKIAGDPLSDEYAGLVKANSLISSALEKLKSSPVLQVEQATQIDSSLIDNELWLSVTSNFVKTYGDGNTNLGTGANKLAEVVVQESQQNSGFAKPIIEAMKNDRQKFNEISLNWGVSDAGIFWDIVQNFAQKQLGLLKSTNAIQQPIQQPADINKTQASATLNSNPSSAAKTVASTGAVVTSSVVGTPGVIKLSMSTAALNTLMSAASKSASLNAKV
jgi:hypothetical protein